MNFGEKLDRLCDEKEWSVLHLCRLIGSDSSQFYRWKRWAKSDESAEQFADLKAGKTPDEKEKTRASHPGRIELIRLARAFDVDLEWLIDDNQSWEDRPKLVGVIAQRFKRLTPVEALEALELFTAKRSYKQTTKE